MNTNRNDEPGHGEPAPTLADMINEVLEYARRRDVDEQAAVCWRPDGGYFRARLVDGHHKHNGIEGGSIVPVADRAMFHTEITLTPRDSVELCIVLVSFNDCFFGRGALADLYFEPDRHDHPEHRAGHDIAAVLPPPERLRELMDAWPWWQPGVTAVPVEGWPV